MRLTIIPSDSAVYKDGLCYSNLAWEGTPSSVHALQWFNDNGWIEFTDDNPYDNHKPENETITELPQWALNAVAAWDEQNNTLLSAEATNNITMQALE